MSDHSSIPDSPTVEIIVRLKLPIGHYEVATGLSNIHDYKYFDDFVSDLIREGIERKLNGVESLYDGRLKGEPSFYSSPGSGPRLTNVLAPLTISKRYSKAIHMHIHLTGITSLIRIF